ncbi:MAG: MFS transporter [Deltaproteobacteria bacterium]|nr:MFS transporter [Deltaproteobacteria bacterium]
MAGQVRSKVPAPPSHSGQNPHRLPRAIWTLGFVSLLMDVSSETVHALLPVFLVSTLGASATYVGWLEGVSEALALMVRAASGTWSDRLGHRKPLAVAGYSLSALTKPLFALASTAGLVFGARLLDRVGKGVRGAPRDALIADLTHPSLRGAAYGLRQSLDTIGAFLGPLLAMVGMALSGDFRTVFWLASIPAVACVALLAGFVEEPARAPGAGAKMVRKGAAPARALDAAAHTSVIEAAVQPAAGPTQMPPPLGAAFTAVVAVATLFTLARFSEAFLILRATSLGASAAMAPLVMIAMNLAYTASAYPAGRLSDRRGRHGLLAAGALLLIVADLVLAAAASLGTALIGAAIWGLHMGLTQGLLAAMVADAAPAQRRGTAFGVYSAATGVALIAASVIAGTLWENVGPAATFYAGAALAGFALVGFALLLLRARGAPARPPDTAPPDAKR